MLNGRTFKYHYGGRGRFHILPQSKNFSHGLCLDNFLQVLLIGNKKDQVPPFRYINQDDYLSCLVRGRKVLEYMKYLMRSVKQAAEAVVIWTGDHGYVNRVNLLYSIVFGKFNFTIIRYLVG